MRYTNIIFDLDGTLIDSSEGVIVSAKYALSLYSIDRFSNDELKNILIGPPLYEGLKNLTHIDDENILQGLIQAFREYYTDVGVYKNQLFEGIEDLLIFLHNKKCNIEILSSKPQKFVEMIIKQHNLTKYFNRIDGSGDKDKKSLKIDKLSKIEIFRKSKTIMIGDRGEDIIAAKKNFIDSLAVTYGFDDIEILKKYEPTFIINQPNEISKIIRGY